MNKDFIFLVVLISFFVLVFGGLGVAIHSDSVKKTARFEECRSKGGTFLQNENECLEVHTVPLTSPK